MDTSRIPPELRGALVVAIDDSDGAREALTFAADLARGLGRPLHVVLVWNFVTGGRPPEGRDAPPSLEAWQRHSETRLAALTEDVPDVELVRHVLHGNTRPTLLAVSALAGHLVVGSRGRGGFAGLMLGSTSEQLVRQASCPVTVVRSGKAPV